MRTALLAFALCFPGLSAAQGPLTPPGAPGVTMRTLDQLDAKLDPRTPINLTNTPGDADSFYRIASSGSYYLTDNLSVILSGKCAIEIAASNVTIDLNGFSVSTFTAPVAIRVSGTGRTNISIRNGNISGNNGGGLDLAPAGAGSGETVGGSVEQVHVTGTGGTGIRVGDSVTIRGCTATNNTGDGILTGAGCTLTSCSASGNSLKGISVALGCTLNNCSARANTNVGIGALNNSTLSNCSSSGHVNGIVVIDHATIVHCSSSENSGAGIIAGRGCTILHCTASDNGTNGISLDAASTVSDCSAYRNASRGIVVTTGSTVSGCTAQGNTFDGIICNQACVIRNNACYSNGNAAGIHVVGSGNRIEGNNCHGAGRGIDVDGAGNIIFRNTCAQNVQNWQIAANNVFGPILDRSMVISSAVTTDSAPDASGSTHPNANFTY